MTEISQIAHVGAFSSVHHVLTKFADGTLHWTLTGIADLSERITASGAAWQREWVLLTLIIPALGQNAVRVRQWAPFITLDAIAIGANAANAGWAVESFHLMDADLHDMPAQAGSLMRTVTLGCALKVRGVQGCVLRLGYAVHLTGTLEPLPLQ